MSLEFLTSQFVISISDAQQLYGGHAMDGEFKVTVSVTYARLTESSASFKTFVGKGDTDYRARDSALAEALEWMRSIA